MPPQPLHGRQQATNAPTWGAAGPQQPHQLAHNFYSGVQAASTGPVGWHWAAAATANGGHPATYPHHSGGSSMQQAPGIGPAAWGGGGWDQQPSQAAPSARRVTGGGWDQQPPQAAPSARRVGGTTLNATKQARKEELPPPQEAPGASVGATMVMLQRKHDMPAGTIVRITGGDEKHWSLSNSKKVLRGSISKSHGAQMWMLASAEQGGQGWSALVKGGQSVAASGGGSGGDGKRKAPDGAAGMPMVPLPPTKHQAVTAAEGPGGLEGPQPDDVPTPSAATKSPTKLESPSAVTSKTSAHLFSWQAAARKSPIKTESLSAVTSKTSARLFSWQAAASPATSRGTNLPTRTPFSGTQSPPTLPFASRFLPARRASRFAPKPTPSTVASTASAAPPSPAVASEASDSKPTDLRSAFTFSPSKPGPTIDKSALAQPPPQSFAFSSATPSAAKLSSLVGAPKDNDGTDDATFFAPNVSAFTCFARDMRQQLLQQNPTLDGMKLSASVDEGWTRTEPLLKEYYEQQAKIENKHRCDDTAMIRELSWYHPQIERAAQLSARAATSARARLAARPCWWPFNMNEQSTVTDFMCFVGEQRLQLMQRNPGMGRKKLKAELHKMWKAVNPQMRKAYEQQAIEQNAKKNRAEREAKQKERHKTEAAASNRAQREAKQKQRQRHETAETLARNRNSVHGAEAASGSGGGDGLGSLAQSLAALAAAQKARRTAAQKVPCTTATAAVNGLASSLGAPRAAAPRAAAPRAAAPPLPPSLQEFVRRAYASCTTAAELDCMQLELAARLRAQLRATDASRFCRCDWSTAPPPPGREALALRIRARATGGVLRKRVQGGAVSRAFPSSMWLRFD
jgi:hypothetical protein